MKQKSSYAEKVQTIRARLLNDYNGVCFYCEKKLTTKTVTIDHFIPLSKGGAHEYSNFRPACKECNQKKADKIFGEIQEPPPSIRVEMLKDRIKLISQITKLEKKLEQSERHNEVLKNANIVLSEDLHSMKIRFKNSVRVLVHYRTVIGLVVKRFNKKSFEEFMKTL